MPGNLRLIKLIGWLYSKRSEAYFVIANKFWLIGIYFSFSIFTFIFPYTVIVEKFIIEIEAQLDDKGVTLSLDQETKNYLAEKGYDEVYGARELSRIIQDEIKKPMAEELIFGKISKGGNIFITFKDDKISFKFDEKINRKKVSV